MRGLTGCGGWSILGLLVSLHSWPCVCACVRACVCVCVLCEMKDSLCCIELEQCVNE